jgi:hypothetical protein
MLFDKMMYPADARNNDFHLPDIPEEERIKTRTQKWRRGKHRKNKLHDRRRK